MKIALVGTGPIHLPWTAQGNAMEILTYELARNMAKTCDVIVYTFKENNEKNVEYDQGVTYRRISPMGDKWYLFLSTVLNSAFPGFAKARAKNPFFSSSLYYLNYAYQVSKDLRYQNCNIVHIHNLSQFVPIIRKLNPDIKIVLHMHCEWLIQLDNELIKKRLKDVDLILSCSDYITKKTREVYTQLSDICQTLHNGVDIDKFIGEKDSPIKENPNKKLLFVGRNSPEKGVHVLMNAFNEVIKQHPDVELEISGPRGSAPIMRGRELIVYLSDDPKVQKIAPFYTKNYLSSLEKKLSTDAARKISNTGLIPRKKLIRAYQNADIFVFPPVWEEPFGMPVVEAMATETPVVATKVGGIMEIVENGHSGILVEPDNHNELAGAILKLLYDENLRNSMGRAARKRAVDYFSWDRLSRKLINYYKEIL